MRWVPNPVGTDLDPRIDNPRKLDDEQALAVGGYVVE
jgi:hypothetical protein